MHLQVDDQNSTEDTCGQTYRAAEISEACWCLEPLSCQNTGQGAIPEEGLEEAGGSPKKRSKSGGLCCWRVCGCGDEDSKGSTTPQGVIRSTWTPSPSRKASSSSCQTSSLGSGTSCQLRSRGSADSVAPREAGRVSSSTLNPGSGGNDVGRQAETAADESVGNGAAALVQKISEIEGIA